MRIDEEIRDEVRHSLEKYAFVYFKSPNFYRVNESKIELAYVLNLRWFVKIQLHYVGTL